MSVHSEGELQTLKDVFTEAYETLHINTTINGAPLFIYWERPTLKMVWHIYQTTLLTYLTSDSKIRHIIPKSSYRKRLLDGLGSRLRDVIPANLWLLRVETECDDVKNICRSEASGSPSSAMERVDHFTNYLTVLPVSHYQLHLWKKSAVRTIFSPVTQTPQNHWKWLLLMRNCRRRREKKQQGFSDKFTMTAKQ